MEGRESMGLAPSGNMAGPPGLHAPSAMRPASNTNNNNPSSVNSSAAAGPHGINLNVNRGMGVGVGIDPVKKKRGRPRKYGPDGSMALALAPLSSASGPFSPLQKRGRGRPPGTGKKQRLAALGEWLASSAGVGFTPHVITIATGEDVASKIMSFSQQGPRAICILSANGTISNVTVRQSASSGGILTYEGRFEILSLSGSFLLTENSGTRSRTGGLSVSLAGPDGRVVGGGVAGMLKAASPVQVVVGSFVTNGQKDQAKLTNAESCIGLAQAAVPGSPAVAIPISRAAVNETYGGLGSVPLNQNTGATAGNHGAPQSTQNMSSLQSVGWSGSQSIGESRHNTDINIPLPGG